MNQTIRIIMILIINMFKVNKLLCQAGVKANLEQELKT